jgi:hypothetical protein
MIVERSFQEIFGRRLVNWGLLAFLSGKNMEALD